MDALVEPLTAPLWSLPGLVVLVAFAAFFAGFAIGRRRGKREGGLEGARFAPLALRKETWEKGYCVICGSAAEDASRAGEGANLAEGRLAED